jgi:hypothetical protein
LLASAIDVQAEWRDRIMRPFKHPLSGGVASSGKRHAGLNKGKAGSALGRAVFFSQLGELRDWCFKHQNYRAGRLNEFP